MSDDFHPCCGNPEMLGEGSPSLKLATNRPLVYVEAAPPGFTVAHVWEWLEVAHGRWSRVCDWHARRIMNPSEAGPNDFVQYVTVADLGAGGVIADQMLPGAGRVLRMRLNSNPRIKFEPTDGKMRPGTVDPLRSLCHEIGHFMGHQHWPVGAPAELMEPSIQHDITGPQPTEAKVSAAWFGLPSPTQPRPSGYDFSQIHLRYGSVRAVCVALGEKRVELESPTSLVVTDRNGNRAVVNWPVLEG